MCSLIRTQGSHGHAKPNCSVTWFLAGEPGQGPQHRDKGMLRGVFYDAPGRNVSQNLGFSLILLQARLQWLQNQCLIGTGSTLTGTRAPVPVSSVSGATFMTTVSEYLRS